MYKRQGLQNIGCFSAGKFFIVTPFYNNGTTDPAKKGTYILDDYGLTDGSFKVTIQDVKLRATSVTGQTLAETDDTGSYTHLVVGNFAGGVHIVPLMTTLERWWTCL